MDNTNKLNDSQTEQITGGRQEPEVPVCPKCGSANIKVVSLVERRDHAFEGRYYCLDCATAFHVLHK